LLSSSFVFVHIFVTARCKNPLPFNKERKNHHEKLVSSTTEYPLFKKPATRNANCLVHLLLNLKILRNYKYIAISCLLVIGCGPAEVTEKNFYTQELLESDVLRLPIKYPFDLISIDESSPWQSGVSLSERQNTSMEIELEIESPTPPQKYF
jgi:hypothetical protein